MLIRDVETRLLPVRMKKDFRISYGTIDQMENVFIKLHTDTPFKGFGEASCIPFITGDTNESVIAAIDMLKADLIGQTVDPALIHDLMSRRLYANGAAKALVDMACYDALAKEADLPLHRYLGAQTDRLTTDVTIGIDSLDVSFETARAYYQEGFSIFKIKAENDADYSISLAKAIASLGDDVILRFDANQGWSADTLTRVLEGLEGYPVEYIEQPVDRKDFKGLKAARLISPIPIMADESVADLGDARNIIEGGMADLINLKLMKAGGIYPLLQIADYTQAKGITCGIGCMMESSLGLSAALAAALCHENIKEYDLDSALLVENTSVTGCSYYQGSSLIASEYPGLGLKEDLW